jgi:hypothetical protein
MTSIHTIFTQKSGDVVQGELGIDDHSNLYWNKKLIVTEKKVKLQKCVNASIILASLSTFFLTVFTILEFFGFGCNG